MTVAAKAAAKVKREKRMMECEGLLARLGRWLQRAKGRAELLMTGAVALDGAQRDR